MPREPTVAPGEMMAIRRKHRSPASESRGTAAVELALISPMLLILLAGIIDFGRVYRQEIELSSAVAAASQYALLNAANVNSSGAARLAAAISGIVAGGNGAGWGNASVTVNGGSTSTVTSGTTTAGGTASNADNSWCPTGTAASLSWGTAVAGGSTCANGTTAGKFVTISGSRAFVAIFGGYGLIGGTTLHQSTIVQSQ